MTDKNAIPDPLDDFADLGRFETQFEKLDVPALSPQLQAKIRAQASSELSPQRPWSRVQRVGAVLALCVASTLLVVLVQSRNHSANLERALAALCWFMLVFAALRYGVADFSRPGRAVRSVALSVTLLAFYTFLVACSDGWHALSELWSEAAPRHSACACSGISFALGGLWFVFTLLLFRRSDPFAPEMSGSFVGLAAGIAAASATGIMCGVNEAWHLLIAHGAVVASLTAAGYVLGRRTFAP